MPKMVQTVNVLRNKLKIFLIIDENASYPHAIFYKATSLWPYTFWDDADLVKLFYMSKGMKIYQKCLNAGFKDFLWIFD